MSEIYLTLCLFTVVLLKSPIYIKLESLNDFARLVCSLERIPLPVFEYKFKDQDILTVTLDIINGRPLVYYVDSPNQKENDYISYKLNNYAEEISLVESIRDNAAIYSPIVKIVDLPSQFKNAYSTISSNNYYVAVGLKDISSLSKLVAYKTIFEESTVPLFLFPHKSLKTSESNMNDKRFSYVLGSPLSLYDSNENNYFYYVLLDHVVEKNFLKFSMQKSVKPTYSNHIDEHGFVYLKIIRLSDQHPLLKM